MRRQVKNFIKVAAVTPETKLGKPRENAETIETKIAKVSAAGARLIVFPELALTGYSLSDLFFRKSITDEAMDALMKIVKSSEGKSYLCSLGLPFEHGDVLYNCVAVFGAGKLYAILPKTYLPNYREYYEKRQFEPGAVSSDLVAHAPFPLTSLHNQPISSEPVSSDLVTHATVSSDLVAHAPFRLSNNVIFRCAENPNIKVGVEICEDLFAPRPPSVALALAGANIILNSSASVETIGKDDYRRNLVRMQSGSCVLAYVYANAGLYESTQDMVFSGHNLVAENGVVLAENKPFTDATVMTDIDLDALAYDRKTISSFRDQSREADGECAIVDFSLPEIDSHLTRAIDRSPFIPKEETAKAHRCEEILDMQKRGIITRQRAARAKKLVVGISGGLDSTLAFLACVSAAKNPKDIVAVSMPCFGTTAKTKSNAEKLAKSFKADFREINIKETVRSHLADINHDESERSVVYENAQARVRTLTLFDIANKEDGLLIGTGDLSELALGWATFGGDHISSYNVNAGIPKTLVRHIIEHFYLVKTGGEKKTNGFSVLKEILNTPVSPELLPPKNGKISQKTEELIGPYELHDFFLYHFLRYGRAKEQILELAALAFDGSFTRAAIKKWLDVFYGRFFANQFKRSCMPDGLKVGSVSLSPRGDFRMPSDM